MPYRVQLCPVCWATFSNLPRHLVQFHGVANVQEKLLLLQLASGRVKGVFKCQVPGCRAKVKRLDKHHVKVHSDIQTSRLQYNADVAKRLFILGELATLRATNPVVPMVTFLDIDSHSSVAATGTTATSGVDVPQAPVSAGTSSTGVDVETSTSGTSSPGTSASGTLESGTSACGNPACATKIRQLEAEIQQVMAQLSAECRNPQCVLTAAELDKYVRLKFSRGDEFKKAKNPN